MKKFFYPKSLAVVGVSESPDNLARGIVDNLLQFNYQGKIFLVGRQPGAAFGLPILSSLRELPGPVDLAVSYLRPVWCRPWCRTAESWASPEWWWKPPGFPN